LLRRRGCTSVFVFGIDIGAPLQEQLRKQRVINRVWQSWGFHRPNHFLPRLLMLGDDAGFELFDGLLGYLVRLHGVFRPK